MFAVRSIGPHQREALDIKKLDDRTALSNTDRLGMAGYKPRSYRPFASAAARSPSARGYPCRTGPCQRAIHYAKQNVRTHEPPALRTALLAPIEAPGQAGMRH